MSTTSARHHSVVNHYITFEGGDQFETLHKPDVMIDPHLAITGEGEAIVTYAVRDDDPRNPREEYDQFATLVQRDDSYVKVDEPDADIAAAWDRFNDEPLMERWVRIYRPDVVHFESVAGVGSGYGYAYITEAAMERAGFKRRTSYPNEFEAQARQIIKGELEEYASWASSDVYGIAQETYHQEPDGTWVRDSGEDCWGYVGTDYVQERVSEGEF